MNHALGRLILALGLLGAVAQPASAQSLAAAVLPASRSVQIGQTATAFATIINGGPANASGCGIALDTALPATFTYQTTNPATNQVTGAPNTPVAIDAGKSQSFVFAITPTAAFPPTDVVLRFQCSNAGPAPTFSGLNTLLLSASPSPVPDVIALGATPKQDGISELAGVPVGTGAFAVATANVGAGGEITVSADTAGASLPVAIAVCQTNPSSGQCLAPPATAVTTTIAAQATPTFAIFITANGGVPFAPAGNRVVVRFQDAGGVTRGATSVAVRSAPPKVTIFNSATILPTAGGLVSVVSSDPTVNGASLDVPARAVGSVVTISLGTQDALPGGAPGQTPVGPVFTIHPSGAPSIAFSELATLTLPIPPGIPRAGLHIATWNEALQQWQSLGGTIVGDFVSTQINHLSLFAMFPAGKSTVRIVNQTTTDLPNELIYIGGPVPPPDAAAGSAFPTLPPAFPSGARYTFRPGESRLLDLGPGRYHFVFSFPHPQPGVANSLFFTVPVLASGADDGQVDQTITITNAGAGSTDPVTNASIVFPGSAVIPGTNIRPTIACTATVPGGIPLGNGDPTAPGLPSRVVNIGPMNLGLFQTGNPITLSATPTDPEGSALAVFWSVRDPATGLGVVNSQGTGSGGTVTRQCGKDNPQCNFTRGGTYIVYATVYDNLGLFDECRWNITVTPNTPPTIAVIVDDVVIDFGRLDAGVTPDRRVLGAGTTVFPGTPPGTVGDWGARLQTNPPTQPGPFAPGGALGPGGVDIADNLCVYTGTPLSATFVKTLPDIEGSPNTGAPFFPGATPHIAPVQYPGGMTCVFAVVADANGDALCGGFVLPVPLYGRGTVYTAIGIPPGAPFPVLDAECRPTGVTVGALLPGGLAVGSMIDTQAKMDAYNATLFAAANAGLLPSQFAADGSLLPATPPFGPGQALPILFEAPDDPDPALTTHDCRHRADCATSLPRGGTVQVEARVTDGFSAERREFGLVAFPDVQSVFPSGLTLTVEPIPPDPGPFQGVDARACVIPARAGVTINFSIVGTDGFTKAQSIPTNASGCADFFIPGGAEGVVDTVTVTVPVQPGVLSAVTSVISYAF